MRILIANDDGMHASQLVPLIQWARKLGDVTVAVPKYEQSAKSHSIEIHKSFEAKEVELEPGVTVWAVDSSPADCVRFAVIGLGLKFDLVISGINRGLNIGSDIMYSGTVAAVSEAVNLGIPALALSTPPKYYDQAVKHLDEVWEFLQKHNLYSLCDAYNVNIPADPKGFKITHQGGPYFSDDFAPEVDNLYRPCGKPVWVDQNDDTYDTDATQHGYISVMPLTINRTNWAVYDKIKDLIV
jgi:5'-nucleotidase